MKSVQNIDRWTLTYALLKAYAVTLCYNLFYRKRKMANFNNVPKGVPVIIAPNHQNALMDALAYVSMPFTQPLFLARSDVFKGELLTRFLHKCKILPIYRIRDGRSNLQKNDEVFDATDIVMQNKRTPLCIFPEGNHGEKRRLRPLVKGIFRIAFRAQEAYGSNPGVKIVPAGTEYEHYWKLRKNQFINFGKPIEVSEYWEEYLENPSVATNRLRERLAEEMKKVMIHIETEEYYDLYEDMRVFYRPVLCKRLGLNHKKVEDAFNADKHLIASFDKCLEKEPEKIQQLSALYEAFGKVRDGLKLRNWVAQKNNYSVLGNILAMIIGLVGLPAAILGLVNNAPHLFIPLRLKKGVKDTQFWSTALFGGGIVIYLIYNIIILILGLIFLPQWWMAIAYLLTIPPTGLFFVGYRKFYIKSWNRIRYAAGLFKKGSKAQQMRDHATDLVQLMDSIISTN